MASIVFSNARKTADSLVNRRFFAAFGRDKTTRVFAWGLSGVYDTQDMVYLRDGIEITQDIMP